MVTLEAYNVPEAYTESYWKMKIHGTEENSRNGPVITIRRPVFLTIRNPYERVLFDPDRNANPFFHVMETIWMLAGGKHVGFPSKFNHQYVNYAEEDHNVHGAYGYRWRNHFATDQLFGVIKELRCDPTSRRAVIAMWDPASDLCAQKRDLPCNTHIYFRITDGHLNMTICNRSNDLLWGMLGANVVHMTYLQELIATALDFEVGDYNIFTNNCHVYKDRPDVIEFMKGPVNHDYYRTKKLKYMAMTDGWERIDEALEDSMEFIQNEFHIKSYRTKWFNTVAVPMFLAYQDRLLKLGDGMKYIDRIEAEDWQYACGAWIKRKEAALQKLSQIQFPDSVLPGSYKPTS